MVMATRNQPTFALDAQKQLWDVRREHALLTGFEFNESTEERFIANLSEADAVEQLAKAEATLAAFKENLKNARKKKGKQPAAPSSEKGSVEEFHPASDTELYGGEGTSSGAAKPLVKSDPDAKAGTFDAEPTLGLKND